MSELITEVTTGNGNLLVVAEDDFTITATLTIDGKTELLSMPLSTILFVVGHEGSRFESGTMVFRIDLRENADTEDFNIEDADLIMLTAQLRNAPQSSISMKMRKSSFLNICEQVVKKIFVVAGL